MADNLLIADGSVWLAGLAFLSLRQSNMQRR